MKLVGTVIEATNLFAKPKSGTDAVCGLAPGEELEIQKDGQLHPHTSPGVNSFTFNFYQAKTKAGVVGYVLANQVEVAEKKEPK